MKLEELHPFVHLFHELEFEEELEGSERSVCASGRAISNLLPRCVNLRIVTYNCSNRSSTDDEETRLALASVYQSCPSVEEVEFRSLSWDSTDLAVSGLRRNCARLQTLALFMCDPSDSCLRDIAGMEALKELYLDGYLADEGLAVLATTRLTSLSINGDDLSAACLQPFVGSNISQSLEWFSLVTYNRAEPMDDVQVATALASCHSLKELSVNWECDCYVFGRNGLEGLQAMATGCPLLASVEMSVTVGGLHFLATHCANLRKFRVYNRRVTGAPNSEGFPSIEELQTLYPAVTWEHYINF